MSDEAVNQVYEPKAYERLDEINDELHSIVRLLGKPTACMSAPEVMDVARMATIHVNNRYQHLALEMRNQKRRDTEGVVRLLQMWIGREREILGAPGGTFSLDEVLIRQTEAAIKLLEQP